MTLILILCTYTLFTLYISYNQIQFIKKERNKQAVILSENDYINAANIAIENEKYKIFSNIYHLIVNIAWLSFGFLYLKDFFIKENSTFENTLFLLAFLLILSILNLPLGYYESFIKDKKHGFSNMTLTLFVKDSLKSLILMLIFGFLIIYSLVFCFEFFGNYWWIVAFALSFSIIIIINLIYPTFIAPIFNKMTKLDDEKLLEKITNLMHKSGFSANGVYIVDASKRDKRLNAYFGGLFKSKRVVLFDTLLKALKENELIAVLGHELGHFVHKDLVKMLFMSALMLFALFFIFAHLPKSFYIQSHLDEVNAGVFALLIIFGNIFTFFVSPFINKMSQKNEFNADLHGAELSSKNDMKDALIALAKENKAFIKSSPMYTFFYSSHPCIYDRIKALQ
ncbi:M48 family metallopeptidase [Campylobacter insulaenigrae]|uniref:Peptidase, M48 family n=1 Tax=Campylobacter insulaenigrae NCTC 12927 TaxID=1031564 RepID=A0A0A8H3P5_9BACT|nr:M48 family metallopeptidase [Campylobacter insulaenigrae]AJC87479.1 peptidase, M48 family [Campylobacter insulaenigrae NCTC 12927]MCR6591206.1 M48 family metallopeptidase [Campylobacter insulaenigrae]MCR6592660.1 M48 family metallopeptidase [Campylobacter insulaenigrae]VEH93489.1 peptidase, M48 family [Campylobacter insulaenigrae]VEJ53074.1 peptidase, M48 family [Campylobacter insulaenigrae]